MKIEDEKVEPATDLGLSLDYCSRYDQGRPNDDPSAGANAGSSVRMTFVSTNPLTELVWSPQRGLSLKCADCSFTERKPSLQWVVGTSTALDSLPEIDKAAPSCSIVPLDELISTSPKEIVKAKSGTAGENTAGKVSIWDPCFMAAPGSSTEERAGNGNGSDDMINKKPPSEISSIDKSIERDDGESRGRQKYSITGKAEENSLPDSPGQVDGNSNSHNSIFFCGDPSMEAKEVDPNNQVTGMEIVPVSEAEILDEHEDSDSPIFSPGKVFKERSESDMSTLPRLEKLEATKENDLQLFNKERTYDVAANVVEPGAVPAGITNSLEEREVKEAVGAKDSTGDSRFLKHQSKGKGKALSDGDLSGLPIKEDDDSYESVESCNSVGRFSSGKRPWSFEQELIGGSKRAKHSEEMPGSSSVKHGSSFMKWISSMTKGFAKSNQDDEDMLTLALSNPEQSRKDSVDHSLSMDRKSQPFSGSNMGFKSIFQSIYSPNKTSQAARTTLCSNLIGETPMEIGTIEKRESSVELQAPKESLYESAESQNVVGPLTLPLISFGNFAVSLDNHLSRPAENKNSGMLEGDQAKVTLQLSNASPVMLNSNSEKDIPLAEEKKTNDFSYKGGALGSSWISRFSSRAPVPLLKQDSPDFHRDQVTLEVKKSSCQESPDVAYNEPKDCVVSNEASTTGFRQDPEKLQDKSLFINSMDEILPSQRIESSEAMTCIFARRLDALKNIIPSHLIDGTARAGTTCIFCGIEGHHLQNCSEISEADLENLLKNVQSYDNAGVSTRLCIRCFQLSHWASSCPSALHKEKAETSLRENIPRDRFSCSIKFEQVSIGHNMVSNLDEKEYNTRSYGGNHLSECLKKPPSDKEVRLQIADVPKGIFAAVKMLRLSRVDILKWMNAKISLLHLDGFFLRLRVGKWEEGLGGTGYYVACISGMQKEGALQNGKSPISVSIGGIKCLVETRYISNQDFLEDELLAWWCTTSRGGGNINILSQEDMERKAEQKKRLGF